MVDLFDTFFIFLSKGVLYKLQLITPDNFSISSIRINNFFHKLYLINISSGKCAVVIYIYNKY